MGSKIHSPDNYLFAILQEIGKCIKESVVNFLSNSNDYNFEQDHQTDKLV